MCQQGSHCVSCSAKRHLQLSWNREASERVFSQFSHTHTPHAHRSWHLVTSTMSHQPIAVRFRRFGFCCSTPSSTTITLIARTRAWKSWCHISSPLLFGRTTTAILLDAFAWHFFRITQMKAHFACHTAAKWHLLIVCIYRLCVSPDYVYFVMQVRKKG